MAVQGALDHLAGERYGWKIAATSAAGQRHIGVPGPLAGRLYRQFIFESGAQLSAARPHMRVVEAELAFTIPSDMPDARGLSKAEVLSAVEDMRLGIEIPESRYVRFDGADAPQLLADDACAGRYVLGPTVPHWRELDLREVEVNILINRSTVAHGQGSNVLDGLLEAVAWIANELAIHGLSLRKGDLITTGSLTKPPSFSPGDQITADYGELGRIDLTFMP